MSAPLPVHIDILRLARQGCKLDGRLSYGEMHRLKQYLIVEQDAQGKDTDTAADIEVEIELGIGDGRIAFIRGNAQTSITMVCQRCLEPMRLDIDARFLLGVVENEAKLEQLPEQYEPLEVSDEPVSLSGIIEDELILALPLVALHPPDKCAEKLANSQQMTEKEIETEVNEKRTNSPFSILSSLKNKDVKNKKVKNGK